MSDDALLATDKVARDRWLAIELRHLAALATVARQASFSGAAETLGYVQSAVSQQIGSLERIVGRRLVDRSARPRRVALTDAGRTLLEHVYSIVEQGELDAAFVPLPIASGPFFALELARTPCVLVAPTAGDPEAILERWPLV